MDTGGNESGEETDGARRSGPRVRGGMLQRRRSNAEKQQEQRDAHKSLSAAHQYLISA